MTDSKILPSPIWEGVKRTLSKEHGVNLSDLELIEQISTLKKAVIMDKFIASYEKKISSSEIFYVVKSLFDFDLDKTPTLSNDNLPTREIIDTYLAQYEKEITGPKIRERIQDIFGVNLDAISALEGSRISLYSKEQWVVQNVRDLFAVHTSNRDITAKVYPTAYFIEQTGLNELPNELKQALTIIGYSYDKENGSYSFTNPTGEPVPDSFKGRTMGAIMEVIRNSYLGL